MATFERSSQHVLSCLKQVCGFKVPELQPVTRFKGFLGCQAAFGWLSLPDCYYRVWDNPMTAISCTHVLTFIDLFIHRALLWSLVYVLLWLLSDEYDLFSSGELVCSVIWIYLLVVSYELRYLTACSWSLQSSWVHMREGLGTRLVVLG